MSRTRWLVGAVVVIVGAAALSACSTAPEKKKGALPTGDGFDDDGTGADVDPSKPPDTSTGTSGSFGAPDRPAGADAGGGRSADGGVVVVDAGKDAGPPPKVYCTGAVKAGDLAVVELMILSKAGTPDSGEWVEIQNTQNCWLKLQNLRIESPRGATGVDFATITTPFELEPHGIFLVADTLDSTQNHRLTAPLFSFGSSDVLKNDGDTVIVKMGTTVIDTITYPSFSNLTPGRSLSFPLDCAWSDRSSWQRWSLSFDEWEPGFKGTPNDDNFDVACY